jgi:hypothetical protein
MTASGKLQCQAFLCLAKGLSLAIRWGAWSVWDPELDATAKSKIPEHARNQTLAILYVVLLSWLSYSHAQLGDSQRESCHEQTVVSTWIIRNTWHLFYNVSYSIEQSTQIKSMSESTYAERRCVRASGSCRLLRHAFNLIVAFPGRSRSCCALIQESFQKL